MLQKRLAPISFDRLAELSSVDPNLLTSDVTRRRRTEKVNDAGDVGRAREATKACLTSKAILYLIGQTPRELCLDEPRPPRS